MGDLLNKSLFCSVLFCNCRVVPIVVPYCPWRNVDVQSAIYSFVIKDIIYLDTATYFVVMLVIICTL